MPEETKSPTPPPPGGDAKPATEKAAVPAKPAAAAPAPPAKPAGPVPGPWDSPMVAKLRQRYGSGIEPQTYLGQDYLIADSTIAFELLHVLRDEEEYNYCVDVTAAHYPQREKQFDVVYILYSFARNHRMRVNVKIAEGASIESVTSLWPTANWLEREVYDMFGIRFEGHPDMKRILLPDDWKGHPLRKDYGIIQQDQEWVHINLGIESGQ
jgi:NADH-quinone oxidoreductase subunit C